MDSVLETERYILSTNPALYLPLWKRDGASFISDDAYGLLCTANGTAPIWTSQGRDFPGTDEFIDLGTDVSFKDDTVGTIEAWMKPAGLIYLFANDDTGDNLDYFGFLLISAGGKLRVDHRSSAGVSIDAVDSDVTLAGGDWHHCVLTSDGSQWRMFVNGVESTLTVASGSNTGEWFGDTDGNVDTFSIGSLMRNSPVYGDGVIGEVRIYSRPLLALEIQHNYLATKWRFQ